MKKVFAVIFVALIGVFSLAGCISTSNRDNYNSASAKDDEWIEIQSVTYYTNNENTTLVAYEHNVTSTVKIETTETEKITQEEYLNVSEDKKPPSIIRNSIGNNNFSVDRKSDLQTLQNSINKTYVYCNYYLNPTYYKATVKSYEIRYVKIRFLDNEIFELNYYNGTEYITIRVKPLSYIVTYFNN